MRKSFCGKAFALLVLLALVPKEMQASGENDVVIFGTHDEVVYGKKMYVVCKTLMSMPEKGGKPKFEIYANYNPSPGLRNFPFVEIFVGDKNVAIDGKADFKFLAIDYFAKGYNRNVGRCIGVLGETGKAFAVKAKIRYNGKVAERSKRLTAKYKVKLIDRKKYKDRWAKYGMSID